MTLWALFVLMSLIAIGFAIWPLGKDLPRQTLLTGACIVLISASAAALYNAVGSPDVQSGAAQRPDIDSGAAQQSDIARMVASLAERLQSQPDDVEGWKMLGRSYMTLGNYPGAADAYNRAIELESARNAQTLVSFGVALIEGNGRQVTQEAVLAFEKALTLEPRQPEALFWGGIGAFNSGNASLAAERWEMLLETDPPADVRHILQESIATWRGEPVPVSEPVETSGVVVANVDLSDEARAALPIDASIFIIARDPAQPSPPIAVTRRSLAELPFAVELGDRESMIPGRSLSAFAEFEMIARVSVSGSPGAQPGDWFASQIVRPAENNQVELLISEQVR